MSLSGPLTVVVSGVVTGMVDVDFKYCVDVVVAEVVFLGEILMDSVVAVVMGGTTFELVNELLLLAWGMRGCFVVDRGLSFVVGSLCVV